MEQQTYIAIVERTEYFEWLRSVLEPQADIARVDRSSLEDAISLIDMTGATLVFVEVGEGLGVSIIESLLSVKPMLTVVGIGASGNEQNVLSAMRAGARDYVSPSLRNSELIGMVRRLEGRISNMQAAEQNNYDILSVYSARADIDTGNIALNIALFLQQRDSNQNVLLLDLGVCAGDSLAVLGIDARYTFVDAVKNVRRLDKNLIDNAFARHASGLTVLTLSDDAQEAEDMSTAEVFLLLGTLQRHFGHIVVNLGGIEPSEFLYLLLGRSKQQLFVVDQAVPSCQRNLRVCNTLREDRVLREDARLIVDRYHPRIPPTAEELAERFGLKLGAVLADNTEQRIMAVNLGRTLLDMAPRSGFIKNMKNLTETLYPSKPGGRGWRLKLTQLFARN